MTRIRFLPLVLAAINFIAGPALASGLELDYHKTVTTTLRQPGGGAGAAGAAQNSDEIVSLYPHSVSIRSGTYEQIFDYSAQKHFMIDHAQKQVLEYPLYALPEFREQEIRSRMALVNAVRSSSPQGQNAPFGDLSLLDFQMEFGLRVDEQPQVPLTVQRQANGSILFATGDGTALAAYAPSAVAVPPPLSASFAKFMVVDLPVLRDIRNAIQNDGHAFNILSIRTRDDAVEQRDTTYSLVKTEVLSADDATLPKDYTRYNSTVAELSTLIDRTRAEKLPLREALLDAAKGFAAKKDYLDVLLTSYEDRLMFGERGRKDVKLSELTTKAIVADENTKALYAVFLSHPANEDALAKNIQILQDSKARKPEKSYLLDLAIAEQTEAVLEAKTSLDDQDKARQGQVKAMMMRALGVNPFLTKTWYALGHIYQINQQAFTAWDCWDTAYRLTADPDHAVEAVALRSLEEVLRTDYPDYFPAP